MSALTFARHAFGREKPHSSITDWVEILTSSNIDEEAYDGVPELVDAINLQTSGHAEASRALRKKLKHGNPHQQYRSLVLLKALIENCGQKFADTFHDGHMTDAIKMVANDSSTDRRVKKKLLLVLGSWKDHYKDDPSMSVLAGLYSQCRGQKSIGQQEVVDLMGLSLSQEEKRRIEKQEAKMRAKQERDERARHEEEVKRNGKSAKRIPFDFEKDKPKVLASIVDGSQASSNLVNAITLVNLATDSLEINPRVQECLSKAKQVRKQVVRYIQLVENEDVIGTLIETNDRLVSALEMYEKMLVAGQDNASDRTAAITAGIAATSIARSTDDNRTSATFENAVGKGKDRVVKSSTYVHPDLEDLNFGPLGGVSANLPPPMRPSALSDDGYEQDNADHRGSLSDYSDYESSDEETHRRNVGSSSAKRKSYVTVSDNEGDHPGTYKSSSAKTKVPTDDDPFADPFADA